MPRNGPSTISLTSLSLWWLSYFDPTMVVILFRPYDVHAPRDFNTIWLSSLLSVSVYDKGYLWNASCTTQLDIYVVITHLGLLHGKVWRYQRGKSEALNLLYIRYVVFSQKAVGYVDWSEWLLFNANSTICQLYHVKNKLIFNEMMMWSVLY